MSVQYFVFRGAVLGKKVILYIFILLLIIINAAKRKILLEQYRFIADLKYLTKKGRFEFRILQCRKEEDVTNLKIEQSKLKKVNFYEKISI